MKRSDKIYEYIRQKSAEYTLDTLKGRVGVDAQEIAEALDILRNNVSMELNALHRQDRIVKILGRPVLYFDKETLEALCGENLGRGPCQFAAMEECVGHTQAASQGPFDRLIGSDRSEDEICKEIGADGLIYQDLDDLKASVRALNPSISFFETSCFDGQYITGDITVEYLNGVENQRGEAKPAKGDSGDDADDGQLDLNLASSGEH